MSAHTPGRVFSWPQNNPDSGNVWCYGMEVGPDQQTFAEHEEHADLFNAAPETAADRDRLKADNKRLRETLDVTTDKRHELKTALERICFAHASCGGRLPEKWAELQDAIAEAKKP